MRTIQHWIAGPETTGTPARFGPVYDPATGEQQAQVALAERADVDAAVTAAKAFEEAIEIVNASPYGNGAAIFTSSGQAARNFQRRVHAGMGGVNVPIPVPMAFYSFGGWKDSLFGDTHVHGLEGVRFYSRAKAVTSRWPGADHPAQHGAHLNFPTAT
jgi:malonate-semialdehyde dehydrogenase (acetylating)/methylmalonate-semialdehyde dehydrogenase